MNLRLLYLGLLLGLSMINLAACGASQPPAPGAEKAVADASATGVKIKGFSIGMSFQDAKANYAKVVAPLVDQWNKSYSDPVQLITTIEDTTHLRVVNKNTLKEGQEANKRLGFPYDPFDDVDLGDPDFYLEADGTGKVIKFGFAHFLVNELFGGKQQDLDQFAQDFAKGYHLKLNWTTGTNGYSFFSGTQSDGTSITLAGDTRLTVGRFWVQVAGTVKKSFD